MVYGILSVLPMLIGHTDWWQCLFVIGSPHPNLIEMVISENIVASLDENINLVCTVESRVIYRRVLYVAVRTAYLRSISVSCTRTRQTFAIKVVTPSGNV